MDLTEKQISFEYKFKGKIVNLRVDDALLPNGTTAKREIVEHNGGVCVAPLDDDYNLYFVKQFRYPYMEIVTELPAGKLEKGEDPFEAGKRELKEETGATAKKYVSLDKLGLYDEKIKKVISDGDAASLQSAKDYCAHS